MCLKSTHFVRECENFYIKKLHFFNFHGPTKCAGGDPFSRFENADSDTYQRECVWGGGLPDLTSVFMVVPVC